MFETLIAVFVVSLIAAALAAVLVLAERVLLDYGECTITINDDKKLTVDGGSSLLEALTSNSIFVPSACGGRGTCAYCKLKVLEGGGILLPTEEPYMDERERKENVRLSCQVKVRNDLRIEIPEELFNIRQYSGECTRITDLTHDMKAFRFELRDPPEMGYVPGQYVQLLAPSYNGSEEVYRAYSISADPLEKNVCELVVRLVPNGICTTWCFEHLKEGDPVTFNGPYGDFRLSDTDKPMIFIAGASGIAPIKCILHHMKNSGIRREAAFYFGANLVKELCYTELMRQFETELEAFTFIPVVARPEEGVEWAGETGLVTEALGRNVPDASGHEAYLCGSPGMIDASISVLTELGMPEENIFYDKFA